MSFSVVNWKNKKNIILSKETHDELGHDIDK